MKGKTVLLLSVATLALVASANAGFARKAASDNMSSSAPPAATGPTNAELERRIEALEQEVEADESKASNDHTRLSTLEQNFNDTQWTFDNSRPTVRSGDGRFSLAFRVRFQADAASFIQDDTHPAGPGPAHVAWAGTGPLSSGAVIRRAYFGVEGKAFNDFVYELRFNGGGSDGGTNGSTEGDPLVNKAVITYTGINHFHLNVGVIEPNFMFEGTTSSAQLTFLERPEIDNIAADAFGAGDSRRGIEANWQKTDALWAGDNLNFTAAFTGGKTGSNAGHGAGHSEQEQVLGRVSERLWSDGISNLQIGASAADIIHSGGGIGTIQLRDRPEIRVDGSRLIDSGAIAAKHGYMYAFDAGMNFESVFLGGEYAHYTIDRNAAGALVNDHPSFSGWYVEGSWFLTGETRSYSPSALNNEVAGWQGPSAVASPFSLDGDSWGAWELAARYSNTDLNWHKTLVATPATQAGIPGGQENVVDLAVNWYLNRNVRLMVDGLIIHVNKQKTAGILGNPGIAPQSQDLSVVGARLQFAN